MKPNHIPKKTSWKATFIRALERNLCDGDCPLCNKAIECQHCIVREIFDKKFTIIVCSNISQWLLVKHREIVPELIAAIKSTPREKVTPSYIRRIGIPRQLKDMYTKIVGEYNEKI